MRVPLSWLRELVPVELTVDDLVAVLNDLGLAVESVERVGEGFDGVVVAEVLEIGAIEGADKIRVVQVDAGDRTNPIQVVCGAWNFEVGDLVPLATVGTVLPGDFAIGKRKMKGVESFGMLCSPEELALPSTVDGILVLSPGLTPGTALADALGIRPDVVLDLEINANRPDAMSILGVARDLAARLDLPLTAPTADVTGGTVATTDLATVDVLAPDRCGRFVARALQNITVQPSPPWLAARLTLAGMRPINNVVDASNYVMLELGIPNHAYDLDRLPGRGLRVRRAGDGETLVTLDDVERRFTTDDLLICDGEDTPVGIAGVMGGASSEISADTTEVLLEAAWWEPLSIARTSKRLGLRSEASARFERGTDPEAIDLAVDRFCALLAESGAVPAAGTIDLRGDLPDRDPVPLRTARVNTLLGTHMADAEVRHHLGALGFGVVAVEDGVTEVTIPSWRPDCSIEVDLVEEVARMHGYSSIPKTVPQSPHFGYLTARQRDRRHLRDVLAGAGASEAWTSTFRSVSDLERAGLDPDDAVRVSNPLVAEEPLLRTSLLPGMLGALALNESHRNVDVGLFELGHTFRRPVEGARLPDEREALAVALAGRDAFDARAVWDLVVEELALDGARIQSDSPIGLHPTRSATVWLDGEAVGVLGEVDPDVAAAFGVQQRVAWLEIDLDAVFAAPLRGRDYRAVSRYPSSDIDLAFEVEDLVPAGDVERALAEAGGDLLASVRLFDVYRGEQVGESRRSLAFSVRLQAADRTLTDDDVADVRRRLIDAVEGSLPATLRG